MNREKVKKLLPLLKAFSEGKILQTNANDKWEDVENPAFGLDPTCYRIKPEPKYVPFASAEEVFDSMKEHGNWIKHKINKRYYQITRVYENKLFIGSSTSFSFNEILEWYVWADDETVFGVMEES